MAATSDIPIVFLSVTDPVAEGFVKSFARPGGNVTGIANWGELHSKELELFKEIVPGLGKLLVLFDLHDPGTKRALTDVRKTGTALKFTPIEREISNAVDAEHLFHSLKRGEADGVFIASANLRNKLSSVIIRLGSEKRLPVAIHRKEWVEKGALFSYGYTRTQNAPTAAAYIDKILKGTKPGDLPVQPPPQLELVINLKTAKQIGLPIPPNVLARADREIKCSRRAGRRFGLAGFAHYDAGSDPRS